jgi:hypothetical protein
MANKTLALSQRQVKALCLGAAQAGFVPEININGVFVRLVANVKAAVTRTMDDEIDEQLERFKTKHGFS